LELATEAFMQAADLYSGEEVSTTSNNCKLKVRLDGVVPHRARDPPRQKPSCFELKPSQ
jgi:hypothetical protein